MKLGINEPIFGRAPVDGYNSPFPSEDSEMDSKFQALMAGSNGKVGVGATAEQCAKAFTQALAFVNLAKATKVGDLLNDWLPDVAWMKQGKTGTLPQGLFADVTFNLGDGTGEQMTAALVKSMVDVGLTVAMTTLAAVPVYGQIAAAVLFVGKALFKLISSKLDDSAKRLRLPWVEYSRPIDEDIVDYAERQFFAKVDWTDLFAPSFKEEPWTWAVAPEKGFVFMPTSGGQPAFGPGLGCMPGTMRVLEQVQQQYDPGDAGIGRVRKYKGTLAPVPWSLPITNCGSFKPSLAQVGAATWQQLQAAGNPDMYKVQVSALRSKWKGFFGNLYASAADLMKSPKLPMSAIKEEVLATQCVEQYLAVRYPGTQSWRMGAPAGYRPNSFWHPDFFKLGPVRPEHRNACLFVEQDLRHKKGALDWPYGATPVEHPSYQAQIGSGGLSYKTLSALQVSPNGVPDKLPKGYRCVPYPTPEMAAADWANPFDVFIAPQLDALEERQLRCLRRTLVAAYVRPVPVTDPKTGNTLPAYAAFTGAGGAKLAKECQDVRAQLLKDQARFLVNLADVDDIDPAFAQQLRAAGVNNSFGQKQAALNKIGTKPGVVDDDAELPAVPGVGGGLAFDDLATEPGGGGSGGGGLLLGGVALAALYALSRR